MFESRGGARVGRMNLSWPFAKLAVSDSELVLTTVFGKSFRFKKGELALRQHRGFISKGILLEHQRSEYPAKLIFWTFDVGGVSSRLGEHGFAVQQ